MFKPVSRAGYPVIMPPLRTENLDLDVSTA